MTSIVMAVRDARVWVQRALESIARHTDGAFEVVVVDNGSAPDTQRYLRSTGVRVLRNDENRGCAAAWNQGIAAARGSYICLVNSDIEVPAGWLDRLVGFHRVHPFAWVSPAVREGPLDYNLDAWNRHIRDRFGDRFLPGEYRGAALLSRRDLYEAVGGFDERFAHGKYEDEDMFWRLRNAGYRTAVTLAVVVHHHGSKTIQEERRRAPGFETRNKLYFDGKWRRQYLRRKSRKIQLAARHLSWRLRHGLTY